MNGPRAPVFEALEERKLLAADAALPSLDFAFASAASEVRVALPDAPPDVRFAAPRELAIVDGAVPDPGAVVAALHRGRESGRRIDVVVIDPERDGIAQVSAALARRAGIDALHFVSHGESGAIRLGSTRLDLAVLAARGEAIGEWSRALAPGADLLVYGCDVAAADAGAAWLAALAALTGADVAASADRTGAAALGGDWVLEAHRGDVGTSVALDATALVGWQAVLATETLDWNAAPSAPIPETGPNTNTYVQTYARGPGTVTLTVSDPSGKLRPENTPAVSSQLTGGMSAAQRSVRLNAQAGFAPGESATVTLTFAGYPGGVSDVRILLLDIDTSDGGGGFVDQVVVSANGTLAPTQVRLGADAAVAAGESTPVQDWPREPYVTFDGARTLTGRFAGNLPITSELDGEANAGDGAANGNAWIRFGQSGITSVSFVYRNARGASEQGIGLYNVLFDVPEVVATADLATTAKNAALVVPAGGVLANDSDNYPGPGGSPVVARVNGTVVAAGPAGTTVALASGARVTMREDGSYVYDPNGAFDTLAPGATTTDSFQYTLSDQAPPTPNTAIATVTVTITSPDLPPALGGLGTLAYTEKDAPTVVVPGATLYDPDAAAYPGGSLAVAFALNGSAEDQLSIRSTGTAAGEIGVSGATVTFGGVAIGTFSGGVGGAPLVVAFNAGATPTAVQALLRAVTYANSSANPSILPRTLAFSLDDGAGASASAQATVTVAAVNDPPSLVSGGALAWTENDAPTPIHPAISVADVDSATLAGATVAITGNFVAGQDLLGFVPGAATGDIAGSYDAGTGELTLVSAGASATLAQWRAALAAVTYMNPSDAPATSARTVTFAVTDDRGASATATRAVTVTALNDDPVNAGTMPTSATVLEDVPIAIDLAAIALVDVDAGGAPLTLRLGVGAGSLLAAGAPGVTVTGTGTASLQVAGDLAALNAFLADATRVRYLAPANANGAALTTLTASASDNGFSGVGGGAFVALGSFAIDVTPVNDAPEVSAPVARVTDEDTPLVFAVANGNGVVVRDLDSPLLRVRLAATNGALSLAGIAGLGFTTGTGTGDAVMTFSGTPTAINAALDGLVFQPAANYGGGASLVIEVDDGGLSASAAVPIAVVPVADPPLLGATPATGSEDGVIVLPVAPALADRDGSENLTLFVADIPPGVTLSDGVRSFTATVGNQRVDASGWSFAAMTLTPAPDSFGTFTLSLAATATETANGATAATIASLPVVVSFVNDAPIAAGAATLAPLAEDTASPPGASLTALFAPCYEDSRDGSAATPLAGVAIVANASRASEGRWQYSADGATWSDLPTAGLADTAALVLPATARLRFVPAPDWNGTPGGLTLRLADASSGPVVPQAGADLGGGVGGSGVWSAGTVTLGAAVTSQDDPPVLVHDRLAVAEGGMRTIGPEALLAVDRQRLHAGESASVAASVPVSFSTTGYAGLVEPSVQDFLRPPSVPALPPSAVVSADVGPAAAPRTGPERLSDGEAFEAQRVTVADAAILLSPPETSTMTHAEYSVEVISTRGIDLDRERSNGELDLDSVRLTGMVLSVGFVWWAMRATGLVASLLASAPAWRHLDPLPVLGGARRGNVEWMAPPDVDAQREEQAAAPVLDEARDDRA